MSAGGLTSWQPMAPPQVFGPTMTVSATRPVLTSATPTTSRPGQKDVAVSNGSGSQWAPSCEVHTGVEGAAHPTAMKPSRQRRTDRTSVSGSAARTVRQWIAVH